MKNDTPWVMFALVSGIAIIALLFYRSGSKPEEAPVSIPVQVETPPAPPPMEPEPEFYPVPVAEPEAELPPPPSLDESDGPFAELLGKILGPETLSDFFLTDTLIRRIVTTVDNLPREKVAVRLWPVLPTAGKFMTTGEDDALEVNPENARRYQPFVELMAAADTRGLVLLYIHYYPLFQQAYQELGYPDGHFHTRLVQVIGHLLEVPDPAGPLKLVRPSVYFKFADAQLESLSFGQKALLRIGSENRAILRGKLTELRLALAAKGP